MKTLFVEFLKGHLVCIRKGKGSVFLQVNQSACPGKRIYSPLNFSIFHRSEFLSLKKAQQILKEMEKYTYFPEGVILTTVAQIF